MTSDMTVNGDRRTADHACVKSRGARGLRVEPGIFQADVDSEREIWIGSDGSRKIRGARRPVSFHTLCRRFGPVPFH